MRPLYAFSCVFLAACSSPATTTTPDAASDAPVDVKADAKPDVSDVTIGDVGDSAVTTTPPPVEDTGFEDFGALPTPATHAEATIGPDGGTLKGAVGSPLEKVVLEVPKGALATTTILAFDLLTTPALPAGASPASIVVRVGPDGVAFNPPARLTMPWSTSVTAPQLVMIGRVGSNWGGLLDPSGDGTAKTLTTSITRGAVVVVATVDLSKTAPAPSSFSPSSAAVGDVVFLSGTGFGLAPAWWSDPEAGTGRTSVVSMAGTTCPVIAWASDTLAVRVPTGATTNAITVATPGGAGTTSSTLVVK